MDDIADTEPVDWENFRNAFEAAAEALVSAIPANLAPIQVELANGRDLEIKLADSPMTRTAVAAREWFSDEIEANAGILRLWAFLALLRHLPSEFLFEASEEVRATSGNIRDEAFIVASTMRLTRNGKLPRQKFINEVEALAGRNKTPPFQSA